MDPAEAGAWREELARKTLAFRQERAEEGFAYARYDPGVRYLKWDGAEKDEASARKWLRLAEVGGNQQATKKREVLEKSK